MTLTTIRKKLDRIDTQIVTLLAKRQSHMREVGEYKRAMRLPYHQPQREKEILEVKGKLAKAVGVDKALIEKIFKLVFKNARELQRK
jgi:chorismate mutase